MGWQYASPHHLRVRQLQLRYHVDPMALVELPVSDGGKAEVLGDELEHHRRLGLDHLQAHLADLCACMRGEGEAVKVRLEGRMMQELT